MKTITTTLFFVAALACASAAHADIHRCTDADGNMVFSQFPCDEEPAADKDEQTTEAAAEDAETEDSPRVEADIDAAAGVRDPAAVAQCKKPYRDAIDAIEARMLDGYTPDQGEAYKKQLLGLTRGLRRCES